MRVNGGQKGSRRVKWDHVRSGGVRWGQVGPSGFKWGQVCSRGVKQGQRSSSIIILNQVELVHVK